MWGFQVTCAGASLFTQGMCIRNRSHVYAAFAGRKMVFSDLAFMFPTVFRAGDHMFNFGDVDFFGVYFVFIHLNPKPIFARARGNGGA